MKKYNFVSSLIGLTAKLLCWGTGISMVALIPSSAFAAERLRFNYGVLGFSLSIDALELYAEEGIINDRLNFYTKRLDERTVKQLRRILSRRINIDPVLLYKLTRSPMVVEIINSLGEVATTHQGHNGFYALRASITNSAIKNKGRGVTLIDVLRNFPTEDIWVNTSKLLELRSELAALIEYREVTKDLVVQQAKREATFGVSTSFMPQLDLRQAGGIDFTQQTITINSRIAETNFGLRSRQPFRARLYLPRGLSKPASLVILSHGFGSEPRAFDYLGEHLASHGIAAVSVEHLGSDSDYELEILAGAKKQCSARSGYVASSDRRQAVNHFFLDEQDRALKDSAKPLDDSELSSMSNCNKARHRAIAPAEFVERPLDIHYVLEELERLNRSDAAIRGTLDLNKVGVIGHSLGGYTSLALAGAEINVDRLQAVCPDKKINLNISLLMQCRAKSLIPQRPLADSRIKGAIAISPIASGIFGEESLKNISIPTAIMSGSEDIIAPVVQEQVYPFTWLSAKHKYLAMMIPGDHFSGSSLPRAKPNDPTIIEEFIGQRISSSQLYIKAFAVAFVKAHIEQDAEYLSYLTAAYARDISNSEIDFNVIRSLDIEPLEREYDEILPVVLPTINQ